MVGRTLGVLLCAAVLAGALPVGSYAQGVVVESAPPGAVVELVGQHVFRGVTPWTLDRGLSGTYEVRAYKAGYDEWEGYVLLSASKRDSLFIRLTRKTPLSAGLRSAIVPGWGQFHTDQRGKGTLFFLAEVAALSGVIWANEHRDDAQQSYDAAKLAYESADQVEEIEERFLAMRVAYDELDRWHEKRKQWSYAAAIVWVANIVDATVLFPSASRGGGYSALPEGDESGFFASIEPERTTAGLVIRF
ncbi:MAG: DUF5683 domain-containing protein [Candidatus Eisenbacteria bacterium]